MTDAPHDGGTRGPVEPRARDAVPPHVGSSGEGAEDLVPEPIPEADSPATERAWKESDAMEGEAPTG